ncbi:hypothetical protein COOONC_05931 [Cooperia oncophora]
MKENRKKKEGEMRNGLHENFDEIRHPSQCAALLPAMHTQKMSIEDDRLTVIEEEKEETSRMSPSPTPSSGFESDLKGYSFNSYDTRSAVPEPLQTVAMSHSTLQSFRPPPQAV